MYHFNFLFSNQKTFFCCIVIDRLFSHVHKKLIFPYTVEDFLRKKLLYVTSGNCDCEKLGIPGMVYFSSLAFYKFANTSGKVANP
jgi:hypothetical protein